MIRLIDADALKNDLKQYFTDGVLDGVSAKLAFNQILHDIDNAPTVEPLERIGSICDENCGYRPQGEWVVEKTKFGDILHCSICGARPRRSEYGYDLHDKFCNECGADMRKGGAE